VQRPSCVAACFSDPSCFAERRTASWLGGLAGRTAGLRARREHAPARFGPAYSVRQLTVVAAAKQGSSEGVSENTTVADAKIDELRQRRASASTVCPPSMIHRGFGFAALAERSKERGRMLCQERWRPKLN
jgi:hypothetical protein